MKTKSDLTIKDKILFAVMGIAAIHVALACIIGSLVILALAFPDHLSQLNSSISNLFSP